MNPPFENMRAIDMDEGQALLNFFGDRIEKIFGNDATFFTMVDTKIPMVGDGSKVLFAGNMPPVEFINYVGDLMLQICEQSKSRKTGQPATESDKFDMLCWFVESFAIKIYGRDDVAVQLLVDTQIRNEDLETKLAYFSTIAPSQLAHYFTHMLEHVEELNSESAINETAPSLN